jgi:integrase
MLLRNRGVREIVDCTPHTLRRTYISLLLAAGCDPAYVQHQVGHTDPSLTLRSTSSSSSANGARNTAPA